MDVQALLDRAWAITADPKSQEIKLSDVYLLIDNLSNLSSTKILSNDLKKLLMTFILENDNGMIYLNKLQFRELFYELFNVELDDLFTSTGNNKERNFNNNNNNNNDDYNNFTVHSFNQDTNYTRNILRKKTNYHESYDTLQYDYSTYSKNALYSEINFLKRDISSTITDQRRLNQLNTRIRKAYDELILRFETEDDEKRRKAVNSQKLTEKLNNLVSDQDKYLGTLNQKIISLKDPKTIGKRAKTNNFNFQWLQKLLLSYTPSLPLSLHKKPSSTTTAHQSSDSLTDKFFTILNTFKFILAILIIICITFFSLSLILDFVNNYNVDNGYFDYPVGIQDSYYYYETKSNSLLSILNPINWFI